MSSPLFANTRYLAPITTEIEIEHHAREFVGAIATLVERGTKGHLVDLHFEIKDCGSHTVPVVRFTVHVSDVFTPEDFAQLVRDIHAVTHEPGWGSRFGDPVPDGVTLRSMKLVEKTDVQ
jgi:hypothetical protein